MKRLYPRVRSDNPKRKISGTVWYPELGSIVFTLAVVGVGYFVWSKWLSQTQTVQDLETDLGS